jgi:ABC-2 type transport system permease protein
MKGFFSQRLQKHQKQMNRYLRYVFNDHFAILSTFLMGGLGLYYSDLLKTLPRPFPLGGLVLLVIWLALLSVGKLATLVKPADLIFLLAKEKQMADYLTQAFRYSLLVPFAVSFLAVGASMPLVVVVTGQTFASFFFYLGTVWLLKISDLWLQRLSLYQGQNQLKRQRSLWIVVALISLSASLYVAPWLGLILALLQAVWFYLQCRPTDQLLDWDYMIHLEEKRLHRIYRFINLFTDVPQITAAAKRRKYFDALLKRIPFGHEQTYRYLYARRFLRGVQYSGLFFRLTLIGAVVLFFVQEWWLSLGLGCLFLYLIGFQLLPLYNEFQYMILTHLYPVAEGQKQAAINWLLLRLLGGTALIFGLVGLFRGAILWQGLLVLLGFLLFTGLFLLLYVPVRLKKMQNQ